LETIIILFKMQFVLKFKILQLLNLFSKGQFRRPLYLFLRDRF
jgi:hypothetical protein